MKVGDSVRPKHDLYKRGIGVIVIGLALEKV